MEIWVSPTESHMVDDTQPVAWGDVDVPDCQTRHGVAKKRFDVGNPARNYSSSDHSGDEDTSDEAWGDATDCPLEGVDQHLTKEAREYAR